MKNTTLSTKDEVPLVVYYLASVREGSRPTMKWALNRLAELAGYDSPFDIPWNRLTPEVVHQLIHRAEEKWSASGVRKIAVVISKIAKIGQRRGIWTHEQYVSLKEAALDHKPQSWSPRSGHALTLPEVRALLGASVSKRDRLIVLLAVLLGLRRAELLALNCEDLDTRTKTLRVKGKGQKIRYVPIPTSVVREIAEWRGARPGHHPLFVSSRGGRLAHRTIWQIIERAAKNADIPRFGVHDLRRTAITHMLNAGHDPILVSRCVGHTSPQVTAVYDRRGDDKTRDVFDQLQKELEAC